MAIVSRTLVGGGNEKVIVRHITVDAADVTASVVYDNSAFINDVKKGVLYSCTMSGSDCLVQLLWDQTTDSPALAANPINSPRFKFCDFSGIRNPGAAGATGDLLLTTTGLASGEIITIILEIHQV